MLQCIAVCCAVCRSGLCIVLCIVWFTVWCIEWCIEWCIVLCIVWCSVLCSVLCIEWYIMLCIVLMLISQQGGKAQQIWLGREWRWWFSLGERLLGTFMLQCCVMCWVAVCCSVLQCVAVCCSVLQYSEHSVITLFKPSKVRVAVCCRGFTRCMLQSSCRVLVQRLDTSMVSWVYVCFQVCESTGVCVSVHACVYNCDVFVSIF